jgi:WD40 repeat protein
MGEPTGDSNHYPMEQDSAEVLRVKEAASILSSKLLLKRLQMLERAVQQNAYHRQQLDYQSLPDVPPISLLKAEQKVDDSADQLFGGLGGGFGSRKPKSPEAVEEVVNLNDDDLINQDPKKIKKLFSFFYSDLVQGRSVTSMVWNSVNSDLLAVGYGKIDNFVDNSKVGEAVDEEYQGGLVLFWSLRNPEYPEKILRTRFPVTSVDFSKLSPMLLAVGLINGDVNIYDIKRETDWEIPVESSNGMNGSHSDPVWNLKWIVKGIERFETLVSISTDGKVLEWSMKKGLIVSTLMQLNRGGSGEGWISRQAAGLGFNFLPNDLNTYIVGTEEGAIHKCSVSYNEQYLDSYEGHEGPVYRIKFSQKWPSIFLSCSADWTIGLYHVKAKAPLLRMRATGEDFAINDIAWCPGNSTVFATVTADAKLQIWDLSVSSIDPVVTVNTNEEEIVTDPVEEVIMDGERVNTASSSIPPTPAHTANRFDRFGTEKEEIKETPLQKLLRNLSVENGKRVLSCLLFGEKSPTIVVGDNKGAVTVYRIIDPITITNEGPIQQGQKLKNAISSQSDPTNAAKLAAVEEEENDGKNSSH